MESFYFEHNPSFTEDLANMTIKTILTIVVNTLPLSLLFYFCLRKNVISCCLGNIKMTVPVFVELQFHQ